LSAQNAVVSTANQIA